MASPAPVRRRKMIIAYKFDEKIPHAVNFPMHVYVVSRGMFESAGARLNVAQALAVHVHGLPGATTRQRGFQPIRLFSHAPLVFHLRDGPFPQPGKRYASRKSFCMSLRPAAKVPRHIYEAPLSVSPLPRPLLCHSRSQWTLSLTECPEWTHLQVSLHGFPS